MRGLLAETLQKRVHEQLCGTAGGMLQIGLQKCTFFNSYTSSPRGNYLAAAQGPELHSTRNELGKSDFPGPIVPIRNNLVEITASAAIMTRRKHSFYYKKKPCT